MALSEPVSDEVAREREALLQHVHEVLDRVMLLLAIAWIALLIAELVMESLPRSLEVAIWVIWGIFVLDFLVEFVIAPSKTRYLRTHWLTAVSLVVPAFRVIRVFAALRFLRVARVVRSVGLLRILTSINRGLGSLRATAARRGVGYMVVATALVMTVGAAGMASFEIAGGARRRGDRRQPGAGGLWGRPVVDGLRDDHRRGSRARHGGGSDSRVAAVAVRTGRLRLSHRHAREPLRRPRPGSRRLAAGRRRPGSAMNAIWPIVSMSTWRMARNSSS